VDVEENVQYVQILEGPRARFTEDSCFISLLDGKTDITIPKNEVLAVRNMLDSYMKYYGAFDTQGREVVL
jgi:hypothetical protein